MAEDSHINLKNILKIERNERKKIVPLEDNFYKEVAKQIRELEEEKRKLDDIYSTKYAILENELKTVRKAVESIIYKRTTKIIKEARHNVEVSSLHGFSGGDKEEQYLDSMTPEEREFYEKLLELMTAYRSSLLDQIFSKTKVTAPPSPAPEKKSGDKVIVPKDKKDISKEYVLVRLLKDIPTFVGADGRNHTLAKEDVAVLSTVNAKALINRNVAEEIPVNR